MSNYLISELKQEASELNDKISNLQNKLMDEAFIRKLNPEYKKELWMQNAHMNNYLKSLTLRISMHEGEC